MRPYQGKKLSRIYIYIYALISFLIKKRPFTQQKTLDREPQDEGPWKFLQVFQFMNKFFFFRGGAELSTHVL